MLKFAVKWEVGALSRLKITRFGRSGEAEPAVERGKFMGHALLLVSSVEVMTGRMASLAGNVENAGESERERPRLQTDYSTLINYPSANFRWPTPHRTARPTAGPAQFSLLLIQRKLVGTSILRIRAGGLDWG